MDELRLRVTPAPEDAGGGFQVEIFVNGVEMTSAGAGLGMDPYDLLIPVNRFVATDEPRTIPVARCGCGVYGCGSTAVTISQRGDTVDWDWELQVPMERRASFESAAYEREIERAAAHLSWETPERTAGRLLLSTLDSSALRAHDLELEWMAGSWRRPDVFRVALRYEGRYQIFLDFEWEGRPVEDLVAEVRRTLEEQSPFDWRASWHAIQRSDPEPAIAGRHWVREQH